MQKDYAACMKPPPSNDSSDDAQFKAYVDALAAFNSSALLAPEGSYVGAVNRAMNSDGGEVAGDIRAQFEKALGVKPGLPFVLMEFSSFSQEALSQASAATVNEKLFHSACDWAQESSDSLCRMQLQALSHTWDTFKAFAKSQYVANTFSPLPDQ